MNNFFIQKLKENGFKITNPRLMILNFFETQPNKHFGAEDLAQQLKNISLASIYRILGQFEKLEILISHRQHNRHIFEINTYQHHDHLSCIKCKKVEEFHSEIIEKTQRTIAKSLGYKITSHSHHIYGLCRDCQK
jgi:Fur family ferric uptake transcriptional regulator